MSEQTPEAKLLEEIIYLLELDIDQNFEGEWTNESYPGDALNNAASARLETTEGKEFNVRVTDATRPA